MDNRKQEKLLINSTNEDYVYVPAIALDLDGTISDLERWEGPQKFGKMFDGAQEFIKRLRTKYKIIIHSCRCNETLNRLPAEVLRMFIDEFLREQLIDVDDIWSDKGKPIADYYMDDKAVFCAPKQCPESYEHICNSLGV